MSMISELVKSLREWADDMCISDVPEPELVELLCKAADTIERLSEKCREKYGRWIKIDSMGEYHCSECGFQMVIDSEFLKDYRFCANCGADMRPPEEVKE